MLQKAKVSTQTTNVRFQPGGTIAARVDKGTVLDVTSEEGAWCIIDYYGTQRYVKSADLEYIDKSAIKQARVIAGTLNVRQQPAGNITGKVHLNDTLEVLNEANGWCKIAFKDKPAYVASAYVEFIADDPRAIARGIITIPGLNVREKPQGEKIGVVKDDQFLDIIRETNGWYAIVFKGKTGYVYGKYVNKFTARVIPDLLNVRATPGGKVIGKAEKDQLLHYLVDENGWLKVIFEGQKAFVEGKYMEKLTDIPEQSVKADKKYLVKKKELQKIGLDPVKKLPVEGDEDQQSLARIWNRYGNLMQELSDYLKIDLEAAIAIFAIESRGEGFWKKNHTLIRFEAHVFHKFWGKDHEETFRKHFKFNPTKRWTGQAFRAHPDDDWTDLHTGDNYQEREWKALEIARKLDDEKALESQSIGAPQILGANYSRLGYASVQDMFEQFNAHIRFHIFGFFDFLDDSMVKQIRKKQFEKFASQYNGPGNAAHYGKRINDYYQMFKKMRP